MFVVRTIIDSLEFICIVRTFLIVYNSFPFARQLALRM